MTDTITSPDPKLLLAHTTTIIAAQAGHGAVTTEQLPTLIHQVYTALATAHNATRPEPKAEQLVPAVPVKRSVFPDYIICLEDGKKLKMLKRHLKTAYNMSPEEYRTRWGLPGDYPLVAPNYAKRRSALAKEIGLGSMVKATTR